MPLLEDDENYLKEKDYQYEVHPQTNGSMWLVIKDFPLPPKFTSSSADLLVIIPASYPNAEMDMFWLYPDAKLAGTNRYPINADQHQDFLGKKWQLFSRHYITQKWRTGVDSLVTHLRYVENCLELA